MEKGQEGQQHSARTAALLQETSQWAKTCTTGQHLVPGLGKSAHFWGRVSVTLSLSFHVAAIFICPFLPRPSSGMKVPYFIGDALSPGELSCLAARSGPKLTCRGNTGLEPHDIWPRRAREGERPSSKLLPCENPRPLKIPLCPDFQGPFPRGGTRVGLPGPIRGCLWHVPEAYVRKEEEGAKG